MSKLVRESISFERGGDPKRSLKVGKLERLKEKYGIENLDSLLIDAASAGNLEDVKFLIQKGADIHTIFELPMQLAATGGYLDVVKYLVEKGGDVSLKNNAALGYAAAGGHLDVVKYLIEQGAHKHPFFEYVIVDAAQHGRLNVVKYLVEQWRHAKSDQAMEIADKFGHENIVKYLESKMNEE